jgi:two-component system phosphate regulon sensor histidine kinase PhoR
MSSKIFRAILLASMLVLLFSLIMIMGVLYNYFSSVQRTQLRNELELAERGVSLSGLEYLEDLEAEDYRITWIDQDGDVLFDNKADVETMQNHMERREVAQALEEGFGEDTRYSSTLADQQFYAARLLEDGSVLRMSITQMSVWALVLGFAHPICLVIFIALALSLLLASRLTKKIVKPINEIDISTPENYYGKEGYEEVEPLLRHIASQNLQLRRDHAQIQKMALIRQEFTANVSHELKTPLHAISGYTELIENGLVKEEDIKPFAGRIHDESSRMTRLVEDIIELTKLDSGETEQTWEECDLLRIAENAIDSLETVASEQGVALDLNGETARMTAVPQLLYSIVYNLCDNAIKYNHTGGRVSVSVIPEENCTRLSVKDTGIGIPEESLDRIFERFYRVDKSHSKEVGGTGLGLSITKHAILLHHGKVEVHSKVNEGSEFVVNLPNGPKYWNSI